MRRGRQGPDRRAKLVFVGVGMLHSPPIPAPMLATADKARKCLIYAE
jgi:hypothetical protein